MESKYTLTNLILGVAPALFTNLNHLVGMAIYAVDEIEDLHLFMPTSAFHPFIPFPAYRLSLSTFTQPTADCVTLHPGYGCDVSARTTIQLLLLLLPFPTI